MEYGKAWTIGMNLTVCVAYGRPKLKVRWLHVGIQGSLFVLQDVFGFPGTFSLSSEG